MKVTNPSRKETLDQFMILGLHPIRHQKQMHNMKDTEWEQD
jgi:hypothetical protein